MLHKIKFQNNIYIFAMCHYKREQKDKKNKTKQKKRSKPLIAVLEEIVKISGIIFESHQRGSSV